MVHEDERGIIRNTNPTRLTIDTQTTGKRPLGHGVGCDINSDVALIIWIKADCFI